MAKGCWNLPRATLFGDGRTEVPRGDNLRRANRKNNRKKGCSARGIGRVRAGQKQEEGERPASLSLFVLWSVATYMVVRLSRRPVFWRKGVWGGWGDQLPVRNAIDPITNVNCPMPPTLARNGCVETQLTARFNGRARIIEPPSCHDGDDGLPADR